MANTTDKARKKRSTKGGPMKVRRKASSAENYVAKTIGEATNSTERAISRSLLANHFVSLSGARDKNGRLIGTTV